jgi:hypothetical protein
MRTRSLLVLLILAMPLSAEAAAEKRYPDQGTFYYDGDEEYLAHFLWTSPGGWEDEEPGFEIDLSFSDSGFVKDCDISSDLPAPYEDSETAGWFDEGKENYAAGSFHADQILAGHEYMARWICPAEEDSPESTPYSLTWQEVEHSFCWLDKDFCMNGVAGGALEKGQIDRGVVKTIRWSYPVKLDAQTVPREAGLGDVIEYRAELGNDSPQDLTDVCLRINHPDAIHFLQVDPEDRCTVFDSSVSCCQSYLAAGAKITASFRALIENLPVLALDLEGVTPGGPFLPGDHVLLQWSDQNIPDEGRMILSMKRDSVPATQTEPDGIHWFRFTLNTHNDHEEMVAIGSSVCAANDWRFYVRHAESAAFDSSDARFTVTGALPCPAIAAGTDVAKISGNAELAPALIVSFSAEAKGVSSAEIYGPIEVATRIRGRLPSGRVIDVKPGNPRNNLNLKSKGTVLVAVLSDRGFLAPSQIVSTSLTFGHSGNESSLHFRGNGQPNCSAEEDVDNNGLPDLLCHFYLQKTGFRIGDTMGILRGRTLDGGIFEARDAIRVKQESSK